MGNENFKFPKDETIRSQSTTTMHPAAGLNQHLEYSIRELLIWMAANEKQLHEGKTGSVVQWCLYHSKHC
jgi:hypothetical protein